MTVPAEGGPDRPRSKHRLMKVVLVLSVTLNIFFIGGIIYSKVALLHMQGPGQRFQELGRELKLSPDQRAAFQKLGRTMRLRGQNMREANQELLEQVWTELGKPQPDQQVLAKLFTEVADNRRAYQTEVGDAMRDFLVTLTPEQRATFIDLAKRRQDGMAGRMWHILIP